MFREPGKRPTWNLTETKTRLEDDFSSTTIPTRRGELRFHVGLGSSVNVEDRLRLHGGLILRGVRPF